MAYKLTTNTRCFYRNIRRFFLGGIAAVSLMLRDVEPSNTAKQLFKALLATNLLGVLITTYAGITGVFVGFGWSDPIFFVSLSLLTYKQLRVQ